MRKIFDLSALTHVSSLNKKQSFGFTLAEVLITLGIIGVVAAITMPTLIQNYQKQVYVNQLKKTVSMLEQGFQKMLADEGVERLSDLPDIKSYLTFGDDYSDVAKDFIDDFLSKGFLIAYKHAPSYLLDKTEFATEDGYKNHMQFNDGSAIILAEINGKAAVHKSSAACNNIKSQGGTMCSRFGRIFIDVNDTQRPNKTGRDIFVFEVSDEGKLYPVGGKDFALYNDPNSTIELNSYYWKKSTAYNGCNNTGNNMRGCAARIMENGWKMDY